MSRQEIKDHAERLKRPGATVRCVDDGETVIVILEKYRPPSGELYEPSELEALAFRVPVPFPDASPDPSGFFVKPANIQVVSSRSAPRSSSPTSLLSEQWCKFSWQSKTHPWNPATDNLETHLATIENRFRLGT